MIKFKRRNCKICSKPAMQNRAICYQHFLEANRKKREDKLAKRAESKAKKKSNNLKYWRSKADTAWYKACLLLSDGRCVLSGEVLSDYAQVHHFFAKGQFAHLRYTIENGIPLTREKHFTLEFKDKSLVAEIARKKGEEWYQNLKSLKDNKPQFFKMNAQFCRDNYERLSAIISKFS